jgi:hypothetical protein
MLISPRAAVLAPGGHQSGAGHRVVFAAGLEAPVRGQGRGYLLGVVLAQSADAAGEQNSWVL